MILVKEVELVLVDVSGLCRGKEVAALLPYTRETTLLP